MRATRGRAVTARVLTRAGAADAQGLVEYLVSWEDAGADENTWCGARARRSRCSGARLTPPARRRRVLRKQLYSSGARELVLDYERGWRTPRADPQARA